MDNHRASLLIEEPIQNAASVLDEARLRAVSDAKAGKWLAVLPSPYLGTTLDTNSFRVVAGLRVGADIVQQHQCSRCAAEVTAGGHHALSCTRAAGRHARHGEVTDLLI